MVLLNWLTDSFKLSPFRALTLEVAAATGFRTCNKAPDLLSIAAVLQRLTLEVAAATGGQDLQQGIRPAQ